MIAGGGPVTDDHRFLKVYVLWFCIECCYLYCSSNRCHLVSGYWLTKVLANCILSIYWYVTKLGVILPQNIKYEPA